MLERKARNQVIKIETIADSIEHWIVYAPQGTYWLHCTTNKQCLRTNIGKHRKCHVGLTCCSLITHNHWVKRPSPTPRNNFNDQDVCIWNSFKIFRTARRVLSDTSTYDMSEVDLERPSSATNYHCTHQLNLNDNHCAVVLRNCSASGVSPSIKCSALRHHQSLKEKFRK
jgi:hypothetical protein